MLVTIEGTYENGKVRLKEVPEGLEEKSDVLITFLQKPQEKNVGKRKLGVWEGKYSIPEDFNEPLDDLKEYM
jgi:hypothetical protein